MLCEPCISGVRLLTSVRFRFAREHIYIEHFSAKRVVFVFKMNHKKRFGVFQYTSKHFADVQTMLTISSKYTSVVFSERDRSGTSTVPIRSGNSFGVHPRNGELPYM